MSNSNFLPLDTTVEKNFPFVIDHNLLKKENAWIKSAKNIMHGRYDDSLMNRFCFEEILAYRDSCLEDFKKEGIPVELFDSLKMVINMDGYGPLWYFKPTDALPVASAVISVLKISRTISNLTNSGVLAEEKDLMVEMNHLKSCGTNEQGLKRWKNRIATIHRSAEFREKKNSLEQAAQSLAECCKKYSLVSVK